MDIFVEYLDGEFAVCRLSDKQKNIIRLKLKDLPEGTKALDVVSMRDNGSFFLNAYAKEIRMKKIKAYLKYDKYCFEIGK